MMMTVVRMLLRKTYKIKTYSEHKTGANILVTTVCLPKDSLDTHLTTNPIGIMKSWMGHAPSGRAKFRTRAYRFIARGITFSASGIRQGVIFSQLNVYI